MPTELVINVCYKLVFLSDLYRSRDLKHIYSHQKDSKLKVFELLTIREILRRVASSGMQHHLVG